MSAALTARLRRVYGLRLLFEPAAQARLLLFAAAIVLVFRAAQLAVFAGGPQWGYDFSAYWSAAERVASGSPLYAERQLAGPYPPQGQFLYMYPPFLAAVIAPFARLAPVDHRTANLAWALLGSVVLALSVVGIARLERLATTSRRALLVVAAAFAFPPAVGEIVLGNVHIVLLGLLGLAWWGVRRADARGEALAGVAIGVAALIKLFPALLVVWFILTGRARSAAWALAAVGVLVLAVLPVTGPRAWLDYPVALLNLSQPVDVTDALAPTVWLTPLLGAGAARAVVLVTALAAVGWAALRLATRASFGVAVTASVLIAPALFHHYLTILVLPMLLGLAEPGPRRWVVLGYLGMWGGHQPALGPLSPVLNRLVPTVAAVSVAAALLWRGQRRPRAESGWPAARARPTPAGQRR